MTIAEMQSVSRAAEKLRLGQPTLSAQLKQLEDNLGIQLFERRHKKLILTEQGRTALDYAKNIFKMGSEMYEALHDRLLPSRTHVQIGALDSVPKQIISLIAKHAYKVGPCNVSLVEGNSQEMLRDLLSHRIDLFITDYLPNSLESVGLRHRSLIKKTVSIFGAPKFKKLKGQFPQSLSGKQFVMPTFSSRLRHDVEHWANANDISLDIIAETQDISLKKLMAVDGLGLIPAASHSVSRQILSGDLIEIGKLNGVTEELFFVTAQRRIENPISAAIFRHFRI